MLLRSDAITPAGMANSPRYNDVISAPATPKIAPDAPALIRTGLHARLVTLAETPVTRYTAANVQRPYIDSASFPSPHRHHMLSAICISPMWRNTQLSSRHHCPCKTSEPS